MQMYIELIIYKVKVWVEKREKEHLAGSLLISLKKNGFQGGKVGGKQMNLACND